MRHRNLTVALLLAVSVAGVLVTACGPTDGTDLPPIAASEAPPLVVSPTAVPTTSAEDRSAAAEARYLHRLSDGLAETIRSQPWFQAMTSDHLSLISAILETERAATARGEHESVAAALEFATEQGWYADGLDAEEAGHLRSVFETYEVSLSDPRAFQIGPMLASTIEYELVETLELPESGTMAILVSADEKALGRTTLDLAVEWLPEVEAVTGAFPYSLLHITVTDLGEFFAGVSNDEFIAVSPDAVNAKTVIHEITHSTLYGIFPRWFEEGFAYFLESYLTAELVEAEASLRLELAEAGIEPTINVRESLGGGIDAYVIDSARGFLFVQGLYEINGIEGIVETIRSLRTQTFNDQELVKRLVSSSDGEREAEVRDYVCRNVIGTTRDYCG